MSWYLNRSELQAVTEFTEKLEGIVGPFPIVSIGKTGVVWNRRRIAVQLDADVFLRMGFQDQQDDRGWVYGSRINGHSCDNVYFYAIHQWRLDAAAKKQQAIEELQLA